MSKLFEAERRAMAKAHARAIADQKKLAAHYQETVEDLEKRLDLVLALDRANRRPLPTVPVKGKPGTCAAVAMASDWHVEEVVLPESVSGLNEFNPAIAERRITSFFSSVLRLTEIERHGADIDTLILWLGGDFLSGYIHPELVENNAASPTETLLWLHERLASGLLLLEKAGGFRRIVIPCSYGNHGRTTDKPRVSTAARNSYEWLLYRILAKQLPQFEWAVADGYLLFLDILGHSVRFHHGDAIRYEGGVGGLTIPAEKAVASWNKARVADLDVFGHHHTQVQGQKWVSNGSLIGYGPYSIKIKAPFEPPRQTYFLIDEARGRTGTWPITLT